MEEDGKKLKDLFALARQKDSDSRRDNYRV